MTAPRKRKSGPSGRVTEQQRHTERVTLRLHPDVAALLRELAAERGNTLSDAVAYAVVGAHEVRALRRVAYEAEKVAYDATPHAMASLRRALAAYVTGR
jgi:uncharacterized protein (DUF1778 family)